MKTSEIIKLTESPRDAQQGLNQIIAPERRAAYINALLRVGFDVLDFGSFVSPKAVPQMAQQDKVLELVDKSGSNTRLMAIVGNLRGGLEAVSYEKVDILGFPYSVSETFLKRNINSDNQQALNTIDKLLPLCSETGKTLRIFMSMAYGNPYGDPWNVQLLADCIAQLAEKGITVITLADTIGIASPEQIAEVYMTLTRQFPDHEFGLHMHIRQHEWKAKLEAAWNAGCRWYEGVLNGTGGCPMTGYELVGNLNTLHLLEFLEEKNAVHQIDREALSKAIQTGY